jgi:hypothetical protein
MARKKSRRRSKKRTVSFMTKKGRVTFKAKKNPVGPRLGTLAIVAGAAFIAYRAYQRQQLAQKLENDRTIAAARSTLMTTGFVAQGYEWLSEPDGVQKEVNRLLPWFGRERISRSPAHRARSKLSVRRSGVLAFPSDR